MERANKGNKFGKLLWYDPNPTDNVPIDLEDLTISVDLEVTSKSRSIIIVNKTTGTGQVSNNGATQTVNVNFFDGSKYGDKGRALTTHYTDIQGLNSSINDDYEALNIESINIEFNSSYAPMIKIKFVDIRGAAMFANNGGGDYKFFFELPYPIFNLTIKGYYGKSVRYCLHLLRFNANFNSQTGNFEIDCDFIGFTYALLTDMLMGLVRASVSTERGAAIFNSIKGEYKNQDEIITIDELVDKISEVDEQIGKVKEGEESKNIALSEKSRIEVESLRNIVLTLLDTHQVGQEKFTSDYKNGILIMSKPDKDRSDKLDTAIGKYREDVRVKINTTIKDIIDFNSADVNIIKIKNALDPDTSGQNKGCKNFVNFIKIDKISTSIISDDDKLITALKSGGYVDGDRLDNIADLLQNKNYKGQKEITLIDLSSAIKACDDSIKAIKLINDESVKQVTDNLKSEIRGVLGFDPTIRNLFRVLCISTETFLQCIYDVSKDAEVDENGLRATELNKLNKSGLDIVGGSDKIYPWPEYKVEDIQNGGYQEEWIGNEKNIVVENVPELQFTEELLKEMLNQKRKDKFREEELNGEAAWYPISVIDTPVGLPPNGNVMMGANPYKIGLVDEIETSSKPLTTADEALRIMMYRAFLLLGFVNRNAIEPKLIRMHAKLEAENLYDALKKIPDTTKGSEIKSGIIGLDKDEIYNKFLKGTDLNVNGEKHPFFEEFPNATNPDFSLVKYTYIRHVSGRAYIPINGNFDGVLFYKNVKKSFLKDHAVLKGHRDNDNCLFVNNIANHTRTDSDITKNVVDSDTEKGIKNTVTRRNYQPNDGAINFNVIGYENFNSYSLTPSFGLNVLTLYENSGVLQYATATEAVKFKSIRNQYFNPIKSSQLSANMYAQMDYTKASNQPYDRYTSDTYTGVDPSKPEGGVASTFLAFFAQGTDKGYPVDIYDNTATNIGTIVYLRDFTFNGFALNYNPSKIQYGWEDNKNIFNGELFKANNTNFKEICVDYDYYGRNREVINAALNGAKLSVPKIEFCVDVSLTYSLFGSEFYYSQNSKRKAIKGSTVEIRDASRAFLFLHCFPFQGVTRVASDVSDSFMFDFNDDLHLESSTIVDGDEPKVLGIKNLFRLHNAFIEAPRIWSLFMGAILWRMQSYYEYNNDDPLEWVTPGTTRYLIPNMKQKGIPRIDEFLSVVMEKETYRPTGMHFNSSGSYGTAGYPLGYYFTKENFITGNKTYSIPDGGSYSRIDETIMGLPKQVKDVLVLNFLGWVNDEFKTLQSHLEIKFNEGPVGGYFLTATDGYENKWMQLNNSYTRFPNTTDLALKVEDIKSILGNNIYENYIMVAPISLNDGLRSTKPTVGTDKEALDTYITQKFAYNMQLKDDGPAMDIIRKLLTDKVYIQNVRPDVWNPPDLSKTTKSDNTSYMPINVYKNNLLEFIDNFQKHFDLISADYEKTVEEEEDALQLELFNSLDDDKIKLNIYRTLMSIYQKWVGGLSKTMFTQCAYNQSDIDIAKHERNVANEPRLIDSFRFLDRSFNDIGDKFYINPQIFYNMLTQNANASFFDIVNKVLSDNNFNFIPLPTFVNFNNLKALVDIFEPYPYNDAINSGPSFVCVYAGQTSTSLDLGPDSNYPDDGIFITIDKNGNAIDIPSDLNNETALTPYETNLPVFAVNYGQQNQNYFKDLKLDQKEFAETAESLEIIDDISQGGDKRKNVMVGQNLFNIYQKRSYSCEVEMLGCPLIQPMMYFQLNNIPMFRGLYLIINVSHSIKPNGMSTTFKGVRVKKAKTPLLSASDVLMTIVGDVSNGDTGNSKLGSGSSNNASGGIQKYHKKLKTYITTHKITRPIQGNTIDANKITNAINTALTDWNRGKIDEKDNVNVLRKYEQRTAGPSAEEYSTNAQPWSAAFSSYIMSEADADFPRSVGHIYYIKDAVDGKNGYEAFPLKNNLQIKPEVGDLACNSDGHCDIIYKVDANKAYLIGGNLGDTVKNTEDNSYPAALGIGDGTATNGDAYYKGYIFNSGDYLILIKKTNNAYFNKTKISSTGDKSNEAVNERLIIVADYFKNSAKLTKTQAAAAFGNIHVETGGKFNPDATNKKDNNNSTDYGIIQWNSGNWTDADCKLGSSNWEKSVGCIKSKVGDTLEAQLDYLFNKFKSFPTWKASTTKTSDVEDAAYTFANEVEKCTGCKGTKAQFLAHKDAKNRASHAKDYIARFKDTNDILYWDNL